MYDACGKLNNGKLDCIQLEYIQVECANVVMSRWEEKEIEKSSVRSVREEYIHLIFEEDSEL